MPGWSKFHPLGLFSVVFWRKVVCVVHVCTPASPWPGQIPWRVHLPQSINIFLLLYTIVITMIILCLVAVHVLWRTGWSIHDCVFIGAWSRYWQKNYYLYFAVAQNMAMCVRHLVVLATGGECPLKAPKEPAGSSDVTSWLATMATHHQGWHRLTCSTWVLLWVLQHLSESCLSYFISPFLWFSSKLMLGGCNVMHTAIDLWWQQKSQPFG